MNMKHTCTGLPLEVRYVHLFNIDDFSVPKAAVWNNKDCIKSRCTVDGYDWEIRFYPAHHTFATTRYLVALELAFAGEASRRRRVTATLTGRLVDYQSCCLRPIEGARTASQAFKGPSDTTLLVYIGSGRDHAHSLKTPRSLTVECTLGVVRDPKATLCPPPSDLHRHLAELRRSQAGADVTFDVSGESFAAHKNILAARSPVFMAEFFGAMAERNAHRVEVQDMDPAAFEAMLCFIYTDMLPNEVDKQQAEAGTVMLQHLLVAADRYGLDRLKVICEERLSLGIDIETAASTLALAERHNCLGLKADCVEFIARRSAKNLDAVMETEGYKQLEAISPSVLTELLKAANGRKRKSSDSN
ncbi:unnamed protein product [Urochloa decumbens]|uniref:BTB domain-containing protein n=1 Tax=Urochloa decumbens TaxID=240449 RepID=A0ABC8VYJ6_9POAL